MTKKLIKINDLSNNHYSINKNIRFKTAMLISNVCDYSVAYIAVKERITVEEENDSKTRNKKGNLRK